MLYPLSSTKLAFLGCGRIAQNIIKGYLRYSDISKNHIFISGRNVKKTERISKRLEVQMALNNEELLEKGSVIFICVKPQDMEEAISSIKSCWHSGHTLISLAAGILFKDLRKWGLNFPRLVRLLPNTSVSVGQGFLPFCAFRQAKGLSFFVERLFRPLGLTMALEDEALLIPATVAGASGTGFVLELMEYWREWLEGEGFSFEMAKTLTVQTFLGASALCQQRLKTSFFDLQKETASAKGVTHSGLSAMRELELERILRLSFEKARLKLQEMERATQG